MYTNCHGVLHEVHPPKKTTSWPGKVVLTRRRAWMLGPCQPAQRDPQYPSSENNSQGTFALGGGEGNDSSKRLESGGGG
jgi:hypothetical protein